MKTTAKVNALPALRFSGRLQSPPFPFGDGSQSASGEELSAWMPSVLDKAFKGELWLLCRCEERSPRRSNLLFQEGVALPASSTAKSTPPLSAKGSHTCPALAWL